MPEYRKTSQAARNFNTPICCRPKGKRFYLLMKLLTLAKEKGHPARFVIRFRYRAGRDATAPVIVNALSGAGMICLRITHFR